VTASPAPRSRLRLDGVTILIVEDDEDSRELFRHMVESFGATALLARDGREGLERAAEGRPSLILLDLRMPGMDGFTVIRRLQANPETAMIRVVAITALGEDTDFRQTWDGGFDGHLVKPITYEDLADALDRVYWSHAAE
jgi:CheY-like chemotaxis protein